MSSNQRIERETDITNVIEYLNRTNARGRQIVPRATPFPNPTEIDPDDPDDDSILPAALPQYVD